MSTKKIHTESPPKSVPTMADVARLAGVNRVTASVALRGARAGTHVSPATRQRILEAARQLGYMPNARALALRRQRTDIIGYYVAYGFPNPHDPFTAETNQGFQNACKRYQQDLLVFGDFERRSPDQVYATLASGKIDGLVLLPAPNSPVVDRLVDSHLPVVAIANSIPGLPSVVIDDAKGSQLLAQHLVQQGHQRVLYRSDVYGNTSPMRRLEAFHAAAATLGMRVTVIPAADENGQLSAAEHALLAAPPDVRPTAVACWVDTCAYPTIAACLQHGLRVPEDVAVVGFDGVQTRIPPAHRLTTIRAPWQQVAEAAVDTLMAMIAGRAVEQEVVFPVELVVGDTA